MSILKGNYCLLIATKKQNNIKVGSLNEINFKKGFYIYIGSAMNSLKPRIYRHLSNDKKLHWHVDYLLMNENTAIKEVIFNIGEEKIECELANFISKSGEKIEKFGSSDCNCDSHLIYFENYEKALKTVKNAYNSQNIKYHYLNYLENK